MHEHGIMEDILEAIKKGVEEKNEKGKIVKIYLKLGRNAHATEESLLFWFDHIKKDHVDEEPWFGDVELKIEMVDGEEITVDSLDVE